MFIIDVIIYHFLYEDEYESQICKIFSHLKTKLSTFLSLSKWPNNQYDFILNMKREKNVNVQNYSLITSSMHYSTLFFSEGGYYHYDPAQMDNSLYNQIR